MTESKVKEITYKTAKHPTQPDWDVLQVVYKYADPQAAGRVADSVTIARIGDGTILRKTDFVLERWEIITDEGDLRFLQSQFNRRDELIEEEAAAKMAAESDEAEAPTSGTAPRENDIRL